MREIEITSAFRRDYKRERKRQPKAVLEGDLKQIIAALAADIALAPRHRDHALIGNWKGATCAPIWC